MGALAVPERRAYAVLWIRVPSSRHELGRDVLTSHHPSVGPSRVGIHWIEPIPEAGKDWSYMFRAVFNGYSKGVETIASSRRLLATS